MIQSSYYILGQNVFLKSNLYRFISSQELVEHALKVLPHLRNSIYVLGTYIHTCTLYIEHNHNL